MESARDELKKKKKRVSVHAVLTLLAINPGLGRDQRTQQTPGNKKLLSLWRPFQVFS